MKNKRQEMILEIIDSMNVETQEELAEILKERNFPVTQATISRDIKELRLIKTLSDKGVYCYTAAEKKDVRSQSAMIRLFSDVVISIEATGNLVGDPHAVWLGQCGGRSTGYHAPNGDLRIHSRR